VRPDLKAFTFSIFVTLFCDGLHAQQKVALVIGNGNYKKDPITNCLNDAKDVRKTLQELGFFVLDNSDDCNLQKMDLLTKEFLRRCEDAEFAVLYYSGHAAEVDGTNYLCPIDYTFTDRQQLRYEAQSLSDIVATLQNDANLVKLIILDACRDNPFSEKSAAKGLATLPIGTGLTIAFSTAAGKTASALSADKIHSLYTAELLN
jgi:uncharacterized caspase-like protein